MTTPDLLAGLDVTGRRGGPYPSDELTAAGADVRGACGWHVAPLVEDHEVLVSGRPGPRLVLPSLRVVDVAVHDAISGREILGWRRGAAGMLIRGAGWPVGEDNLRIVLHHGYDECPADLVAVVLERTRALASAPVPGTYSTSKDVGGVRTSSSRTDSSAARTPAWTLASESILARYRV